MVFGRPAFTVHVRMHANVESRDRALQPLSSHPRRMTAPFILPAIASRTRALDPVLRIRHLFTLKPTWTLPELSPYLQYAPASLPALRNALHAKLIGANCRKDRPPAPTMLLPFSDH